MPDEFIDAYAHCGISKYKPVDEVLAAMRLAGVDRAVLVQHLGEFDNRYLQQVVTDHPEKFAGVMLVDHSRPSGVDDLARWASTESFRGARLLLESLDDNRLLWERAVELGLNIVVLAAHHIASGIDSLEEFLQNHPAATIILSHFGLGLENDDPGFVRLRCVHRLAVYPGVYYQVSGMHMFCGYPFEPFWPLVTAALDSFGAERMLWGGNYPVCGTDAEYAREAELARAGGLAFPPDTIDSIACETARRIWF